jgi:hypothetical protein
MVRALVVLVKVLVKVVVVIRIDSSRLGIRKRRRCVRVVWPQILLLLLEVFEKFFVCLRLLCF